MDSTDWAGGREFNNISSVPASPGAGGPWQRITIDEVSVEVPAAIEPWVVQITVDPCSSDLRRFLLLVNTLTGDRMKVDMATRTVTAEIAGPPDRLNSVLDRIRGSFSGERQVPADVARFFPLPTSEACDPSVTVPMPAPVFEAPGAGAPPSATPADTPTAVVPPTPPPPPSEDR